MESLCIVKVEKFFVSLLKNRIELLSMKVVGNLKSVNISLLFRLSVMYIIFFLLVVAHTGK